MTIDLKDKEVIQAIKDAGYISADEVKGLKDKRDELLSKLANGKATAAELEEAQSKLKEIEQDALKKAENWTELEARLLNDKNELEKTLKAKNGELTNSLIESTLIEELVTAKVAPHFMDAAKAMIKGQVEYSEGKISVGDKPLTEFVSEWAQSDNGKHFIAAPDNSGGGAPGGGGAGDAKTKTRSEFEALSPQARSDFFTKEQGKVVDD